ncbi:hypothetical protein CYMTET_5241 [Cymbomonas tetramitiformis]|uniref:Uncharacterized protein n=1 Tax=Cymbomonas tetramitiformis TaxID=36881 RepID=A0AAE0LJN6_9CHLO|nr:hypothetical protein CYMTET_5241 [Cymbomonas tetramitiformis]
MGPKKEQEKSPILGRPPPPGLDIQGQPTIDDLHGRLIKQDMLVAVQNEQIHKLMRLVESTQANAGSQPERASSSSSSSSSSSPSSGAIMLATRKPLPTLSHMQKGTPCGFQLFSGKDTETSSSASD